MAEEGEVGIGEEELVPEVGEHATELTVDEVQGAAEILSANTHKRLDNIHLGFAAAADKDIVIQSGYQFVVGIVAAVEVLNNSLFVHTKCKQDKRCAPAGAVLTLETMPEHAAIGRLDDESQKRCILELRVLAADK